MAGFKGAGHPSYMGERLGEILYAETWCRDSINFPSFNPVLLVLIRTVVLDLVTSLFTRARKDGNTITQQGGVFIN